jgi:enterochelin esterase-like enzyme
MEKSLLKSTAIMNLKDQIEKGNCTALQEFWDMVENKGTPLVEELDGDFENSLVTFVYKTHEEIENVVFIPPVGWANFSENRMERLLETNLWYITYKIKNDIRFNYFLSVNDTLDINYGQRWEKAIYDKFNKNALVFKSENGKEDQIVSYVVMPNAEKHSWVKERNHSPKGKIYEHQFHSKNLKKHRRTRIYTPSGYDESNKPYEFLVLTDGDEYINILSATTVLDNLIADKKIPPIVAIFIDSDETRFKELTCNDTFGDIIVKELLPWVRENYKISDKADEAVIGGLSLGGLTASYIGLKHSQIFGNILSESGSYWYKPEGYEKDNWLSGQFEAIDKLTLKFYLNVGVLESKDKMIDTNIKLRDTLIKKGYDVNFEYFKSGHDYLSWGETLANGLISLIGDK